AETQSEPKLVRILPNLTCTVSCPPGYSRHEIDFDQLRGVINSGHPFVVQIIPEADSQARLVFLAADFVRLAADAARRSNKAIKCVVFDLDNTLWKGILIENDDVTPDPEMVRLVKHLDQRGVLLSVASKNDFDSALVKLKALGLDTYFLAPQINWGPKSI